MRYSVVRKGGGNAATTSLIISLLMVFSIALVARLTVHRFLWNDIRILHSHRLSDAMARVLADVTDAEAGQRGYLLTGSSDNLGPFRRSTAAIGGDLSLLETLSQGDSVQEANARIIAVLAQDKMAELGESIAQEHAGGHENAVQIVKAERDSHLMRRIRAAAAAMDAHERAQLAEHTRSAERSAIEARSWTTFATLVAVVFTFFALVLIRGYRKGQTIAEAENVRLAAAAEEAAERQRIFLRDVLSSVTEGRLLFCEVVAELPPRSEPLCKAIALNSDGGLSTLRSAAIEAARLCGISETRGFDLITSASEAGMNAIAHAGGGEAMVCTDRHDVVQVWVEDHGAGISLEHLPHATLERGYSTSDTLGHGFYMILQMVDRVYLLTGPAGTTVVLEQYGHRPPSGWIETQMEGIGIDGMRGREVGKG